MRNWRNSQPDRYLKLQRGVLPEIRARAAESHTELAELEGATARKLLARLDAEHKDIPARDLSTAVRNLDVGQGIHRTKAAELRGENPDAVAVGRSFKEIMAALKGKNVEVKLSIDDPNPPSEDAIEGTAEESRD